MFNEVKAQSHSLFPQLIELAMPISIEQSQFDRELLSNLGERSQSPAADNLEL